MAATTGPGEFGQADFQGFEVLDSADQVIPTAVVIAVPEPVTVCLCLASLGVILRLKKRSQGTREAEKTECGHTFCTNDSPAPEMTKPFVI